MPIRNRIPEELQELVRQRANFLCEYCHASEKWQYVRFTVDHIVPYSLGGNDNPENLALACFHCNRRKTNRLVFIDPETGEKQKLFNPRKDNWQDHFIWSKDGLFIKGLTSIGNATIEALIMNRERVISIRSADKEIARHPPPSDPIKDF